MEGRFHYYVLTVSLIMTIWKYFVRLKKKKTIRNLCKVIKNCLKKYNRLK